MAALAALAAKHKQLQILQYIVSQLPVKDVIRQRVVGDVESYDMISSAVQGGSPECVSILLEVKKSLVHEMAPHYVRETPLVDAMHLKHVECLPMTKLLLSYGANPNAISVMKDAYGLQSPEVFKVLEDAGGKTKLFGSEMLNEQLICIAARLGSIAVVEDLIAKGIDVNAAYPHGQVYERGPPLWGAVDGNYGEIVARLVAAGADPGVANC